MERIDKILVNKGYGSRKEVHKLIKDGFVKVDGDVVTDKGLKVSDSMSIFVRNIEVSNFSGKSYILMNKPKGVVSATKDSQETVLDLISQEDRREDFHLVGRLDKDTTGLLIITNDGDFSNRTLSPKRHIEKKYFVTVDGKLEDSYIDIFSKGMELSDFITKPATLEIVETSDTKSTCYVTISEGKFHQIKRMFHFVGLEVLELQRVSFGKLILDKDLKEGEYRFFNESELVYVNEILEGNK